MRIVVVHSFYRQAVPSGENQVVMNQCSALADAGHEVELVSVSTDDERQGTRFDVSRSMRVVTGLGPPTLAAIEAFRPDVVHVHNTFPNIGWRTLAKWPGPIIHTLHNFRPICAAGTLFRDDADCRDCLGHLPFPAIRHACYHDSRLQTIPLALRNAVPAGRQGLLKRADALIVGSRRARSVYEQAGVPPARLHVIPNGVEAASGDPAPATPRHGWVVAARLEEPKGVLDLVRDWPQGVSLDVFGAGPQQVLVENSCRGSVAFRGQVPYGELRDRLASALGLVMPSKWLEMNPTIVSDALALGTPIVALEDNVTAEVVETHHVGATYSDAATLRTALDSVATASAELEPTCIEVFASEYSYGVWVERLEDLYRGLVANLPASYRNS